MGAEIAAIVAAAAAVLGLAGGGIRRWRKNRTDKRAELTTEAGRYSDHPSGGFRSKSSPEEYSVVIRNLGPAYARDISATLRNEGGQTVLAGHPETFSLKPGDQQRVKFTVREEHKGASVSLWVAHFDGRKGKHEESKRDVTLSP
jgi:hypothetical protein